MESATILRPPSTGLSGILLSVEPNIPEVPEVSQMVSISETTHQSAPAHMKIPAWFPGGKDTYFCSILRLYPVWIFTNIQYRWNFIFSNRSKEFQA